MKPKLSLTALSALIALSALAQEPPKVIEGAAIDKSVDPSSVRYTVQDTNILHNPTNITVPKEFASEAGLTAVGRRLARDVPYSGGKIGVTIEIYSAEDPNKELAEYFHNQHVHEIRISDPQVGVSKIIMFEKRR